MGLLKLNTIKYEMKKATSGYHPNFLDNSIVTLHISSLLNEIEKVSLYSSLQPRSLFEMFECYIYQFFYTQANFSGFEFERISVVKIPVTK